MVMVVVDSDQVRSPPKSGQGGDVRTVGRPRDGDLAARADRDGAQTRPVAAIGRGQLDERLLALSKNGDVGADLLQRRARRGRRVRSDDDEDGREIADGIRRCLGHAQFGRCAAPEEIARRGREDDHVGAELHQARANGAEIELLQLGVDQANLVSGTLEERLGVAELERQVRLAATEVDALVEGPRRIDQSDLHDAFLSGACRDAPAAFGSVSQ